MAIGAKKQLEQLLSKQVDRKEFLTHVGAAGLGIIGVTGLLKALNDSQSKPHSSGYGSSPYGGHNQKSSTKTNHV